MRKLAVALSLSALSLAGLSACPNDKSPANSGSASPAASPGSAEEAQVSGAEDARIVSFQGRSIDLGPHIAGYPYRSFRPYPELGALLYMHEGDAGRTWWTLPLGDQPDGVPDLASGRKLNDIDWTTRSNRGGDPLPDENALLFLGDEDNREEYDLYKLFLEDGRVEKWTDVPYVYGAGVDDARDRVLYVARYPIPDSTEYRSCLEEKPLPDGDVRSIVCDDADLFGESTFTWTSVVPSPDGAWAYVRMNVASDRNQGNLWRIRLDDGGAAEQLTENAKRTSVGALEEWLDDDRFVYIDDASGFSNVGVGSHASGELDLVTDLSLDLKDVTLHPTDAGPRLLVAVGTEQVKSGDALATLVPPRRTERVALTIDGNDASLVAPGRKVRLQFEGWPAVQFVGWPSVATGTFGGIVDLVDPASAGAGNFRVLVRPDPDDVPWPDPARLRPGVQTQGWVLLDTVSLGYELWRQFNGFPPVVEAPPGASKVEKGK